MVLLKFSKLLCNTQENKFLVQLLNFHTVDELSHKSYMGHC